MTPIAPAQRVNDSHRTPAVVTEPATTRAPVIRIADADTRGPAAPGPGVPAVRPPSTPQPAPPAQSGARWYSPASRVGGWSRANYNLTRDLWALGGPAYRSGAVATGIVGTAAAAWADAVGFLFGAPLWVSEPPPPTAKSELVGMVGERALHPPPGFEDMSTAMRLNNPRYTDTLSYPETIRRLQQDPVFQREFVALLRSQGVSMPEFVLRSLLDRPELFMRMFAWGPDNVRTGFQTLNRAYQQGQIPGTERDHQLPRVVDLNTFDLGSIQLRRTNPVQVAGPLHYGELPSDGDPTRERQNRLWAEVLDRLSANEHVSDPAQRFTVRFGDKSYTSMREFLTDLTASGHQLEVRLRMQAADLADMSVRNPDGTFTKVALPTFSTLGITGSDGRQALVPWVHFQLDITVRPPEQPTRGPRLEGTSSWYQGVTNIGFFPGSVDRDMAWTNGRDYVTVRGESALRTVLDSGLYADTISTTAQRQRLRADGYGVFGHCGDSILVGLYSAMQNADNNPDIQMDPEFRRRVFANPARTFAFPYMINPAAFRSELEGRVNDSARPEAERATYRRLLDTVNRVSDDAAANALPNPDAARRALDVLELVWPRGEEPFEAVTHAKQAISDYLRRQPAAGSRR